MLASRYKRVTAAEMKALDRAAIEQYGIPAIVLMENAGSGAARVIARIAHDRGLRDPDVAIVCGRGNNGGDGFVIARHLHNRGYGVRILFDGEPGTLSEETATNYVIARKIGLAFHDCLALGEASLIVDALLGVGLSGEVRPRAREIIGAMNDHAAPKIAIDVPSGLDCDTGMPLDAAVTAAETITFGLPKVGFFAGEGSRYTGSLHVVDIGLPVEITK